MWNRRTSLVSGLGPCALGCVLLVGCLNAQGERVTLQEWMASQAGGSGQTEQPADQAGRSSRSDATDARSDTAGGGDAVPAGSTEIDPAPPQPETPPGRTDDKPRVGERAGDASKAAATVSVREATGSPPSGNAIRSDVLLVNNETIRVADILEPISRELERLAAELPPVPYGTKAGEMIRQEIIESVAEHLIWRKAKQMLNEDMEKNLKKAVDKMEKDRINREFQGRETLYDKYLAKHGKTRGEVRERLRRSIVIDSYLRERLLPLVQAPRKQELLNYYNANLAEYSQTGRREMFLIEVPVGAFLEFRRRPTEEELAVATSKAHEAISQAAEALRQGEPFEEVAKRYSRGANAEQGGAWGMIEQPLKGRWETPSKRLFEMKEGETSEIIEIPGGFFIVRAGRVEPSKTLTFDEAQPQIAGTLRQRRFLKLRADFLQNELNQSTLGSLDEFVAEVLRAVPEPKMTPN